MKLAIRKNRIRWIIHLGLPMMAASLGVLAADPLLDRAAILDALTQSDVAVSKDFRPVSTPVIAPNRCHLPGVESAPLSASRPAGPYDDNQPSLDLTVEFEFDSARISPMGMRQLDELASALTFPALQDRPIIVAGHTDATGAMQHNEELACNRAGAIVRYLKANHVPQHLTAMGFGARALRIPDQPTAAANRRVEVRLATE